MSKLKLLNPLRYDVEDGETVYSPGGEWVDSADFDDLADAYRELMEENARLRAAKEKTLDLLTTPKELELYDANHDGRLDDAERAKMKAVEAAAKNAGVPLDNNRG